MKISQILMTRNTCYKLYSQNNRRVSFHPSIILRIDCLRRQKENRGTLIGSHFSPQSSLSVIAIFSKLMTSKNPSADGSNYELVDSRCQRFFLGGMGGGGGVNIKTKARRLDSIDIRFLLFCCLLAFSFYRTPIILQVSAIIEGSFSILQKKF